MKMKLDIPQSILLGKRFTSLTSRAGAGKSRRTIFHPGRSVSLHDAPVGLATLAVFGHRLRWRWKWTPAGQWCYL